MVANPEAYNYQGEDALTAKRITWTPTPIEAPKEPKSSDGENLPAEGDTTSKEVIMTEEEANKMVEDFLNDPETPSALSRLRLIEEKYRAGSLPESINNRYKQAKEKAIQELQSREDFESFKSALIVAWVKMDGLEKNLQDKKLQDYSEEEAARVVEGILGDPATKEQLEQARSAIITNCNKLDQAQRKALEQGIEAFKLSIGKASKEIWIN